MTWLQKPLARQWGWIALAGALGFAAGNYHATDDAVKGSARWWQAQVRKDLRKHLTVQQQADYDACAKVVQNIEASAY